MQCYKTVMLFSADNECLGDNRTQPTPIIESHRTQAKVNIQLILLTAVKKSLAPQ